jgi:general secretion pathway protein D
MPIRERSNSTVVTRARLLALAPLTGLLLWPAASAQQPSALAQAELQRRATNASEARLLLEKGDEAYEAGRWADAITAYTGARDLLPETPATHALRNAATERLVQASVEQARHQRRIGDVKGAGETIDRVLDGAVAPDAGLALEMRAQLEDPIRTNPAATLEHTRDVEEVRTLLYRAQGFENLGDFNRASVAYEDVLRVDPTNKAARRGMETVARHRSDYARAAYDETRAAMLAQVDGAWELRLSRGNESFDDLAPGGESGAGRMLMGNKLERIIVPVVDFDGVNIREAFDFLRQQSIELDTFELNEDRRGINFVLELGGPESEVGKRILATPINLQLKNVPLSEVVRYINEITRTVYVPQEWAVAVRPAGADSADLIVRTYRVPPDFLTSGGGAGVGAAPDDPFAEDAGAEGLLPQRLSAEDVLKGQGVTFPEGASASFNAGTSTLRISNTEANHALVDQIVEALSNAEPAMVQIEVRMIRTQQRILEELGFDWLLGEFSLGGSGLTPGAPAGVLTGGDLNPLNMTDVALPPGEYFRRALTSGNRSGNEAIIGDSIDDLILEQARGFSRGARRAPGILWANGKLNNTDVVMLMRGLDQKKGVDLVVSPSTVTRSGQQSKVEILREFIYPTEYEPPELPNTITTPALVDFGTGEVEVGTPPLVPITPATPTSFETRGVGVVLDVLPTVSADRYYVDLALSPSVTDFDGFINYGTPITSAAPSGGLGGGLGGLLGGSNVVEITSNEILMPVFSVMSTETNLTVADGTTLVIGGMLQEKLQKVEDKTKILGDLPLVGRMFQSHAYAPVRTAVVFLVTVNVVDPTGQPFRTR